MAQEPSQELQPGGICFEAESAIKLFAEAHHQSCSNFAFTPVLPEVIELGTEVEVDVYFDLKDESDVRRKKLRLPMTCMGISSGNGVAYWKVTQRPIVIDLGFGEYLTCFETPHYNGPKVWYASLPLQRNSKWSWLGTLDDVRGEQEILYYSNGTPVHPEILWIEQCEKAAG